jgi:hypothetical protein
MGLDDVGPLRAPGLDGVGVDRPLPEHGVGQVQDHRLPLEHGDEGVADRLPLRLGIGEALEGDQELGGGVHDVEAGSQSQLPVLHRHPRRLVLPHEAVVDVQELEPPPAQGLLEQERGHGGVHAPGGEEEDVAVPHFVPDGGAAFLHLVPHRPVRFGPADGEHEVEEDLSSGKASPVADFRSKVLGDIVRKRQRAAADFLL